MLKKFYLNHYRFKLVPHKDLRLGQSHQGITLRGAFGTAFRRLCCYDIRARCEKCPQHERCPYALIFEPTVPAEAERLRLNTNIPRPFIIKPPLADKDTYTSGEELEFDLIIIGKISAYLPYFIACFSALASEGMGAYRSPFSLKSVTAINGDRQELVYSDRDKVVRNHNLALTFDQIAGAYSIRPDGDGRGEITLRFHTPTILKADGQIVRQPEFHHILKRLRDRINALAYFYCGETLAVDYKALGEAAESVRRTGGNFQWQEVNRYSTKRHIWHELSGFTGHGVFSGDLRPYLPLLALGEYVHVGKGAAFGNGWYEIIREK